LRELSRVRMVHDILWDKTQLWRYAFSHRGSCFPVILGRFTKNTAPRFFISIYFLVGSALLDAN